MSEADPVFAEIERFAPFAQAVRMAELLDGEEREKALDAAHPLMMSALDRVYEIEPTTPEGLLALMKVMLEWDGDHLRLTEERRAKAELGVDAADRALVSVFHHAKRLLEVRP